MNNWLPQGYEVPKSPSNYFKLEQGANKFRIMSAPILGYLYWNKAGKPVRLKEQPSIAPEDMRDEEKIRHFWAFIVWNYKLSRLQILEITQVSIQGPLTELVSNDDWGSPEGYDITISKKGEKLDTEYTVTPSPHKDAPQEAKNAFRDTAINLGALFDGADPFNTEITAS